MPPNRTSLVLLAPLAGLVLLSCERLTGPANEAPSVVIISPATGVTVVTEDPVTLEGTGSDPEDGTLAGSALRWSSDLDGVLGTGSPLAVTLSAGTHEIVLRAADGEGEEAADTVGVVSRPNEPPVARIDGPADGSSFVEGDPVPLAGSGEDREDGALPDAALAWASDLDGPLGAGASLSALLSVGTHAVTLHATDRHGADAEPVAITVVVEPRNEPPEAAFGFGPASPVVGQAVRFDGAGSSDPEETALSYSWDFDGDGVEDAAGDTASWTFAWAGDHVVWLTVTDEGGLSDDTARTVTVAPNQPPVASLAMTPESPEAGEAVSFDGTGSSDPEGTALSYSWDFDADGAEDAAGASATWTFETVGAHAVTLTVTDAYGGTGDTVAVFAVRIPNEAPTAAFGWSPTIPVAGQAVSFDGTGSSDPEGSALSYSWDFDGDGAEDATGATPGHTFAAAGEHAVALTVTDDAGLADDTVRTVTVAADQPPVASFAYTPTIPVEGEAVSFDGTGSSDPEGTALSYSWDFDGDGAEDAAGATASHTFGAAGDHPVTLTVMDGAGLTDDTVRTVTVAEAESCSLDDPDTDGDRLPDCAETGTGVYNGPLDAGTSPTNPDTDGDGISDGDEALGTVDGLDLPAMGANPLRADILLEYDWFDDANDCALHSHRPTAAQIAAVEAAFNAAPVSNPDGSTGINVINDYGQGGAFTGGNFIDDDDGVIAGGVNGSDFLDYKAANFAANRHGYFHWVLLPHRYGTTSGSSGQAELFGDDMIVSLQCFVDAVYGVANTIVHELGHNLGLRHGGFENTNWKPNYNSVMNYKYQFPGVDNNCTPPGDGVLDYSTGGRPPLDETDLSEPDGICGSAAAVPWDWNGDGDTEDVGLEHDINTDNGGTGDGVLSVLHDYDDWANLYFLGIGDADGLAWNLAQPEIISCRETPDLGGVRQ